MKKELLAVFGIILFVAGLFYPVGQGKIPFPADSLLGLYHPWRDVTWDGYTAGVPYRNFLTTDPMRQTYPWRKLAIDMWKAGEVPLWNPYSFTGTPLLANYQSAVLYPLNVIFFFGDFPLAWSFLIFLTPLLAMLFFYFWLRNRDIEILPALFGAVSFSLGGFMMGWMTWGTVGHSGLWLPLMLFALDKMRNSSKRRWPFLYLVGSVSSLLAGHLQTAFYVQLIAFAYGVFMLKSLKKALLLAGTAVLIAGIQIAPTLEFIVHSARSQDLEGINGFLPYRHLVMFLIPDFFGNPATGNYWGEWNYLEFLGYIGVLPLLFALHALFTVRTRTVAFLGVIVLGSIFLATQTPLAILFSRISQAASSRFLFVTDLGLAALAAFGLNEFLALKRRDWRVVIAVSVGFLIVGTFLGFGLVTKAQWIVHFPVIVRNSIIPLVLFAIGLCAFWLRPFLTRRRAVWLVIVLLIITALDLGRNFHKFTSFSQISWVYPKTTLIQKIQDDPDYYFRVMANDRRIIPPNVSVAYGLESIEGYDPLYIADYGRYIVRHEQNRNEDLSLAFRRIITPERTDIDLPNRLNAKYVLSLSDIADKEYELVFREGETRLYRNIRVLPRISIDRGKARIVSYSWNRLKVVTETEQAATLIVRDPASFGWRVYVDTISTPLQKVDGWFRAVNINRGTHTITFTYWPSGFTVGILFSALGLVFAQFALWKKIM